MCQQTKRNAAAPCRYEELLPAMDMLEAGVPIMAIKNFLGHSSITTTERYAELSQGTVNKHIRDWNEKWFSHQRENIDATKKENALPDFLK